MKSWGGIPFLIAPAIALAQPAPTPSPLWPPGSKAPAPTKQTTPPAPTTPPPPATASPAPPPPATTPAQPQPIVPTAYDAETSIAPPVPPPDLPPPGLANEPSASAGYQNGLYVATRDDTFRIMVRGWALARWELGDAADDVQQRFVLPSTRLIISGHAFSTVDYNFSAEVSSGVFELRDAFLDQPLPIGRLRFGQFKQYFSHQQMMPRPNMTFSGRAPTFAFAGIYRDIGAAIHHEPRGQRAGIEVAVGMFNGVGITPLPTCVAVMDPTVLCTPPTTAVVSGRPQVTARIGYRSARADVDRDDDIDHDRPRYAFGVGYAGDLAHGESADMVHNITADVLFKAYGLAAAAAIFFKSHTPAAERELQVGWHAQVGYTFVPRLVEVAGRFSQVPALVGSDRINEALAAINIYRRAHRLKWQVESGITDVTGNEGIGWVARVQTTLIF